ncbi:DUF4282 domain-containing protein [Sporohalobacter salinus]|uniref:DUF4282 domain-containing protein n=1 Tax=Sporohalobacter salinus TaxID=1494606 RepID=UPI001961F76B|nr:DUF4282 domain-containing protein [Sporohalobacter salinus]MBM7624509.1 hypothetical protein [Sporohalobacter salinus]
MSESIINFEKLKESFTAEEVSNFFSFKSMVSNKLAKISYVVGLIGVTLWGLGVMFNSSFIIGLLILVFGNLFWRVSCEAMIVMFSIHETLVSVLHTLKHQSETNNSEEVELESNMIDNVDL